MEEAILAVEKLINTEGYHYVVTPNADHIVRIDKDEEFKKIYDNADLRLADGMSIILIGKILKKQIKEKVSGSDLMPKICEMAAKKGYSIFLLGAAEGVAKQAAEKLTGKYANLIVAGTYSPSFGFEKNPKEIDHIVEIINKANPHILFVGVGSPKQEKFMYTHLNRLKVPISLAIGASIDFEAGNKKRAPKWISNAGLEWLYRVCKEPRRMYKRVFIDDVQIIGIVKRYWKDRKK